jgi:hypothetical protein
VDDETIYRQAPDVVLRRIGDEAVLVPVRSNVGDLDSIFTLNQSAITIWESLDGNMALHRVIDRLCTEYDVERETAAADTRELVSRLDGAGLIERVG